jgi:hypothetical protein
LVVLDVGPSEVAKGDGGQPANLSGPGSEGAAAREGVSPRVSHPRYRRPIILLDRLRRPDGTKVPHCRYHYLRTPDQRRLIALALEAIDDGPDDDASMLDALLAVGADMEAARGALATYRRDYGDRDRRPYRTGWIDNAPAQPERKMRSVWERRLGAALNRLGVRWSYEPDYFTYSDGTTRVRRYTPDFRLDDFANTYVEVKGPSGVNPADDWKMRRVLKRYPGMTLLLWDAMAVEYVEDAPNAAALVSLLTTTKLAA